VITSIDRASLSPRTNKGGSNFSYDPGIDGQGRYVIFTSLADNFPTNEAVKGKYHEHAYLGDTLTGRTIQLDITPRGKTGSPGRSFSPFERSFICSIDGHISRDANYAVFKSFARNLAADHYHRNGVSWVYRKNIMSGAADTDPLCKRR